MTIEQTVEIPADRRVFFEFLAPREIPEGPARVELIVTPVFDVQEKPSPKSSDASPTPRTDALKALLSQPTPLADSLLGVCKGMDDITLEQIREERLARQLK